MPAARYVAPEEGWNQNKTRSVALYYDQHRSKDFPDGRPWWGYTETPADPTHPRGVVGELQPVVADLHLGEGATVKGWDAPWTPESKYVQMSVGILAGNRFKLDYSRMTTDYQAANERYYRKAAMEAGARNWPAPKMYGLVQFQLRAIVGDPPKSPKIPEAAQAGDPWLLGFSDHENERLKAILDRETGRFSEQMEEADEDEQNASQPTPRATTSATVPQFTPDELAEITAMLKQRKQMANARTAKTSHAPKAA